MITWTYNNLITVIYGLSVVVSLNSGELLLSMSPVPI